MHELFGFAVIGILMLIVGFFDQKMAMVIGLSMMIHLAQDMTVGISMPFNPVDKTEVRLMRQDTKFRVVLDVLVIIIFGILWIRYLNAPVWQ